MFAVFYCSAAIEANISFFEEVRSVKKIISKLIKILSRRVVVVALLILLQLAALMYALVSFSYAVVYIYIFAVAVGILTSMRLISKHEQPDYAIAWIILMLVSPTIGVPIYYIFRGNRMGKRRIRKMQRINETMGAILKPDTTVRREILSHDRAALVQSDYISDRAFCPAYRNFGCEYFPSGEKMFPVLLRELRRAEKYIFLEYFIIAEGYMWSSIFSILREKAAIGVDVRVIYDDIGASNVLPRDFAKKMRAAGVKCREFNRFVPVLSASFNNRDHRKIAVIDGKTAFTGGINIADEYINRRERFGYWKDTAVMLRGDAAWSMTVMFLSMWDYLMRTESQIENSYRTYMPEKLSERDALDGCVQPYTDNPLDHEAVGQTIYLNMIYHAERYIYITTPYLIIDYEMKNALCVAAKSGVDVRIITPGKPDKFFIHELTQAGYSDLIENGVKIYEFTPGFIHAKMFVCDDKYATVGTVNLDFRSLFLHFECGVWTTADSIVRGVREDFTDTVARSKRITQLDCKVSFWRRSLRDILSLFAPLC